MRHTAIILVLFLVACEQVARDKTTSKANVQELEAEKTDSMITHISQTKFTSTVRPNEPVLFNEIYTDTLEFSDYNDDLDYWYLKGRKNGKDVSLIYTWDWRTHQDYNFRQGDLIAVEWKMDSIVSAGDEEVVDILERAINAKRISPGNQPIQFLKRQEMYDESTQTNVDGMVINHSYLHNITPQEKAALAYVAFDIGNECEYGYDSEGNERVLWCRIISALDLDHQCSQKQLSFLRKWFSKDTVALKKLESCRTIPNTATIQTTFDEILIQKNETEKTITVSYKVTGINMRESESWHRSQTDIFKYDSEHIILIDSKKSDLTKEETNINPDAPENIDPQNFVLALKDHILNEWQNQDGFDTLKIKFGDNILNIRGNEGFTLSRYDFNEMVINGTKDPQTIYLTVTNEGGGAGGNVGLVETYSLTVLDAEHFDIKHVETDLAD